MPGVRQGLTRSRPSQWKNLGELDTIGRRTYVHARILHADCPEAA